MFKIIELFNSKQKKSFSILIALVTAVSILEMLNLAIIIPIINSFLGIENKNDDNFLTWISKIIPLDNFSTLNFFTFFIIFFSLKTLFSIFVSFKQQDFIYNFIGKTSYNLFSRYLSQDYKKYSLKNSSELIRNIIEEINLLTTYLLSFMQIILEIIILLGVFIFLLYFLTIPTIIVIFFSIIVFFTYYFMVKKNLFIWGNERQSVEKDRITYLQESFTSIKEINFFNRNTFFLNRFKKKNKKFYEISSKFFFLNSIPRYIFELFTVISILILFAYLVLIGSSNDDILKIIAIFLTASFRVIPSIYRIFGSFQNLKYSTPSFNVLYDDLKDLKVKKKINKTSNLKFKKKIILYIKKFTYQNNNNFNIKDFSMEILKNQKIGIIGKSGSGKSSIIDVLTGIISDNKNISLKVDDSLIKTERDRFNWQNKIGLIPQGISILNTNLRENVLFGLSREDYSDKEILEVLSISNLSNLVARLSDGLDHKINERGINFSGGEIQRIGIARALLKNPEVLIFDEATSALDTFTENEILKDINSLKNKTTIIVSHRMNTLKYCDKIFLIDKGRIKISSIYNKFNEK